MAFDEILFPLSPSQGAAGGPSFKTEIVSSDSGAEGRSQRWSQGRVVYDAAYGVRKISEIAQIITFFRARGGKARGFRFKDFSDFTSAANNTDTPSATDQVIGIGNGSTTQFQLIKNYASGLSTHVRNICKPVANTVVVAIDGTPIDEGTVDPMFVSRNSEAYYFDSIGDLQMVNYNVARYGYDPATLSYLGLITDLQNTWNFLAVNKFTGLNTPTVGVIGSGGALPPLWELSINAGLTCEIVGYSTENNMGYMDIKFSGTMTSTQTNILRMNNTANLSTYYYKHPVLSAFLRLMSGSLSNLTNLKLSIEDMYTSDLYSSSDLKGEITSAALRTQRKQYQYVFPSNSNTYLMPDITFDAASGTVVNFTLRIGIPQFEANANDSLSSATGPILTDGNTYWRAADVLGVPTDPKKFTIDNTTGIVTISSAPATNAIITAGYEFNVPVRFDTDSLTISLAHVQSGSCSIPLIEVRV